MAKKSNRPMWFKLFLNLKALVDSVPDETVGKAIKAIFTYFDSKEIVEMDPLVFAIFSSLKPYVDESFSDFELTRARNRKNINSRWGKNCTTGTSCINSLPLDTKNTEAEAEAEAEAEEERESTAPPAALPTPSESKKPKVIRHQYGQYGWVKLSDEEYSRLSNDLGEAEVKRCIEYVDESAQSTGNKNKWRDWNLVIRRCHRDSWGLGKVAKKSDEPFVYDPGDKSWSL